MKALIAALLVAVATPVAAANIEYRNHGISLVGPIVSGDAEKFALAAAQLPPGERFALYLDSGGGEVGEAQAISKILGETVKAGSELYTVVPDGGMCASACVPLFAMGTRKALFGDAGLWVHSVHEGATYKGGVENSGAMDETMAMAKFMQQYGTPASVLSKMLLSTDPAGIQLDAEDLTAWGVMWYPAP